MTVGERIKLLREKGGYTQTEFASLLGVSKQNLYKYENNIITNIPSDKIEAAASLLNVSPGHLMGWESDRNERLMAYAKKISVLGKVAAGIPIEAITDVIGIEEITEDMARTGDFFGLQIKGDSMIPTICDQDIVIVRMQNDAENGDTVIAQINGNEATCKRLRKYRNGIELIPNNPAYDVLEFSNAEILEKPVRILGKVVELRRKF